MIQPDVLGIATQIIDSEQRQLTIVNTAAALIGLGVNIEGAPTVEAVDAALKDLTESRLVRKLAHALLDVAKEQTELVDSTLHL